MKPTIYIDQNVLSYLSEGLFRFPENDFQCVFSETHFKEIPKENPNPFICTLDKYFARIIRVNVNEKFEVQDNAKIYPYTPVRDLYNDFLERQKEPQYESVFDNLLARFAGAENFGDVIQLPKELHDLIESQISEFPFNHIVDVPINLVLDGLSDTITNSLKEVEILEKQREQLGTDKGKLLNIEGEEILVRINEVIKSSMNIDLLTLSNLFLQGKPKYLKIAGFNALLNQIGFNADTKLSSIKKIPNIRYDGEHMGYAIFCNILLSEDRRLIKKAAAIYQYLDIGTEPVQLIK